MVRDSSTAEVDTMKVTGTANVLGTTVYVLNSASYFKNQSDGLYHYGSVYDTADSPALIFKYPANPGDQYSGGTMDSVTMEVDTMSITVPAGTFFCYTYSASYPAAFDECYYFSPGVGQIICERTYPDNSRLKIELLSYYVGE